MSRLSLVASPLFIAAAPAAQQAALRGAIAGVTIFEPRSAKVRQRQKRLLSPRKAR
jgi:hypothetical protein